MQASCGTNSTQVNPWPDCTHQSSTCVPPPTTDHRPQTTDHRPFPLPSSPFSTFLLFPNPQLSSDDFMIYYRLSHLSQLSIYPFIQFRSIPYDDTVFIHTIRCDIIRWYEPYDDTMIRIYHPPVPAIRSLHLLCTIPLFICHLPSGENRPPPLPGP